MRKFFVIRCLAIIYMLGMMGLSYRLIYNEYYAQIHRDTVVSYEEGEEVYPLGEIVGIYTKCNGVFVIDTCEIESMEDDFVSPAGEILKKGDYLLQVNGIALEEKETLVDAVDSCEGEALELLVVRGETSFIAQVTPVLGKNGNYMLGVWVKDDLAGVGTITYYTQDGEFAALGHGMGDGVTKDIFSVSGGDIYFSKLVGIQKGKKGEPGEVKGIIYYGIGNHIGELDTNCKEGIFGIMDKEDVSRYNQVCKSYKIGKKEEIERGKAQIISNVSGERRLYDIEITYVDYLATNSNKGIHIQVTDDMLLDLTGGIVQGMSGSPIIQNGKIIGAVTHVLINDPEKGYGIFIEEMIK